MQRAGASRFAQRQIERHRRLAPVADLCVRRIRMSRWRTETFIVSSIVALVAASVWVIHGACVQPFPTFRTTEALVQVGVGLTVCVLWVVLAAVICAAVIARRIRRWWLLCLVLTTLGFFVVMPWPFRYVSEIEIRLSDR